MFQDVSNLKGHSVVYKNILTYGTYDLLLLKRAKSLGGVLYLVLSSDAFNIRKGKTSAMPYDTRRDLLTDIRSVDFIFPENHWEQKKEDIKKYNIDCFVMGSDWSGKFDDLKEYCDVIYLERTQDISSSLIKKSIHMPK